MNRRAGATDRHTLLTAAAYPSSSRSSVGVDSYRSSSPFEQPHSNASSLSSSSFYSANAPPHANGRSYHDGPNVETNDGYSTNHQLGAPKKEPGHQGSGFLGRMAAYASQRTAEDLEEQNDQKLEGLSARVKLLKDITTSIGQEVRDSTNEMGTLGEAFSNTSAFLSGTVTRMNRMAKRQGGWFCNMMLFLVFITWIFIFLWWWRR